MTHKPFYPRDAFGAGKKEDVLVFAQLPSGRMFRFTDTDPSDRFFKLSAEEAVCLEGEAICIKCLPLLSAVITRASLDEPTQAAPVKKLFRDLLIGEAFKFGFSGLAENWHMKIEPAEGYGRSVRMEGIDAGKVLIVPSSDTEITQC